MNHRKLKVLENIGGELVETGFINAEDLTSVFFDHDFGCPGFPVDDCLSDCECSAKVLYASRFGDLYYPSQEIATVEKKVVM